MKYYDIMKAMAGSVVRTGDIGAGNATTLANQIIVAINTVAVSKALTLTTKVGVSLPLTAGVMEIHAGTQGRRSRGRGPQQYREVL